MPAPTFSVLPGSARPNAYWIETHGAWWSRQLPASIPPGCTNRAPTLSSCEAAALPASVSSVRVRVTERKRRIGAILCGVTFSGFGRLQVVVLAAKGMAPESIPQPDPVAEAEAGVGDGVMSAWRFRLAVLMHDRAVYRVAAGILRDSREAEDVTQEVFLSYWQHGAERSEERRVGKECRSRRSPGNSKKERMIG